MANASNSPNDASLALAAPPQRALRGQFLRFALVGVVGTAAHYGVMLALVELARLSPLIGTCGGFLAGLVASYVLNRNWTFDRKPSFAKGFIGYFGVCAIGLGINVAIVALALKLGVHYMAGQVVATVVALFWNFLSSRFLVFR